MTSAIRICFVGDSFVNGTGDDVCLGWAGRLCRSARESGSDVTYYNLGVRRDTSADIASRWRGEVTPRLPKSHPGAIVFSFGVNDCTLEDGQPRVMPDASLRHAQAILGEAKRLHPVLMIGPAPIVDRESNVRIGALSAALVELCREIAVPCLPVFETLCASPVWHAALTGGDGAHPDSRGYEELASVIGVWPAWRGVVG